MIALTRTLMVSMVAVTVSLAGAPAQAGDVYAQIRLGNGGPVIGVGNPGPWNGNGPHGNRWNAGPRGSVGPVQRVGQGRTYVAPRVQPHPVYVQQPVVAPVVIAPQVAPVPVLPPATLGIAGQMTDTGFLITRVVAYSEAQRIGLEPGDVIVQACHERITCEHRLQELIQQAAATTGRLELVILDGRSPSCHPQLVERVAQFPCLHDAHPPVVYRNY